MKKLSLEMLRLTSDEVLQRSQMKKITGGYGSAGGGIGRCIVTCTSPNGGDPRQFTIPACFVGCPQIPGVSFMYCVC